MSREKTILICNNDLHVVRAIEYRFRKASYHVLAAQTVDNAWRSIETHSVDAVVTDVRLSNSCGLDFVEQFRATPGHESTPVILLTDKGFEIPWNEVCERLGVITIVPKPFSPRELLSLVDDIVHFGTAPARDAFLRTTFRSRKRTSPI